jgi:hypothetical protein
MFRRIPWQDVCKFLAGAFFVNAGILFYLYLARVSVPILGTGLTETPESLRNKWNGRPVRRLLGSG